MTTIELIYDGDCPNVAQTRSHLLRAFAKRGLFPQWSEWDRSDPASPAHVRDYGSPTILVDGKDIAGVEPSQGIACCRLYAGPGEGFQGAPSVELIAAALPTKSASSGSTVIPTGNSGWRSSLTALPGIAFAFLPKIACPACWPAYAGVLSSLGLGFLLNTAYLLPLTLLFLLIAVGALGFRAKNRRGYGPFALGLLAATIVIGGKFLLNSDPAMYGGIALLVGASLWNGWPRMLKAKSGCPSCASPEIAPRKPGSTNTTVEEIVS